MISETARDVIAESVCLRECETALDEPAPDTISMCGTNAQSEVLVLETSTRVLAAWSRAKLPEEAPHHVGRSDSPADDDL